MAATAIYYREQAKMWRESAAAVPDGAPQQAVYREIAEGYEKIAAQYERREQLEQGLHDGKGPEGSEPPPRCPDPSPSALPSPHLIGLAQLRRLGLGVRRPALRHVHPVA